VLRELLTLGWALEGGDLEAHVLQATGRLYLLDLYPKAREARLVPYELGPEQCRRFLWVGDPPASNATRDRATTRRLTYLLGQVPTFRTPLTPGGNIAVPPAGAPRSRDGGPG
jgi:CRISPR-associated protein Csh1